MKKFNLSQIMKTAHNLCKNCPAKYTTFSAALKQSWKMAKFNVSVAKQRQVLEAQEKVADAKRQAEIEESEIRSILFNAELEVQRIKVAAEAKVQLKKDEIAARKEGISYSEYQNRMNRAYGYGCGMYCGD